MAEQGSKAFQAGNMVKAAEQYLLAARTDPEEPNYLFGAARAEHSARQFDAAELHYRAFALTANADPTRVAKVKQYLAEIRTERAGERAAEAQALTQKGDSMLAASTWLEAYQLAQDRPQYLLQAALAERQAGDPAACLAHLDAYLRVAPADAPERAKAQSLVSQMRKSSGTTPTPAPAGEPQAKPTPVQPTPTPEPVAGGVLPAPVETVTSPADPPGSLNTRTAGLWTMIGGGGVAIAGMAVLGWGLSEQSALDKEINFYDGSVHTTLTPAEARSRAESIGTHQTIGAIVGGAGLVAAGVGAWLWFRSPSSVTFVPTPNGIAWSARF